MTVNVISESVFFQGQWGGVHTAFLTHTQVLKKMHVTLRINSFKEADITHIHTFGPFALYKMLTSKRVVISSHHLPSIFIGSYKGAKIFNRLIKFFFRFYYNRADLVLALNNKTKKDLITLGVTKRIEVLPNAINTELFKKNTQEREFMRSKYDIQSFETVVMGAGYIIPRKGVDDFIELIHEFPQLLFVWVGGRPNKLLTPDIKQKKYLKKNRDQFIITGIVPHDEMPSFYNMADVFLFPSFKETQGLAIIEAAACGLPLILRDLPEYKDLYSGSYIACRTHAQFRDAIKLLTTDKKLYQKSSDNSLKLAQKFSLEAVGGRLVDYYSSI